MTIVREEELAGIKYQRITSLYNVKNLSHVKHAVTMSRKPFGFVRKEALTIKRIYTSSHDFKVCGC